jgi:ABC-type nitrate/sulfonate/bicarbonate transport system substrate-binding protein
MTNRPPSSKASFVALLIAVVVGWRALGASEAIADATQRPDRVTVIRYLSTRGNVSSFEIAAALGWLQDKGINIESQGFSQGGPESLVALASGSVDIAGAATPAIINAIAGGAKVIGVMPDGGVSKEVNSKFFVPEDSDIKTARDLKDKSIAVNTLGAHLDYTMREYLRNHGLNEDDANLITVPGPQLEQVLRHKQADVVAVGAWQSVFGGKIEASGGVRVLFTDFDVLGNIVLGTDVLKTAFIDKQPQAVTDFVTTSARAVDWTREHPEEARKLFAQILQARGDNPELATYWPGYGLREHALYTDNDAQFWINVLVRGGRIKSGQLSPAAIETNQYNTLAHLAQQ